MSALPRARQEPRWLTLAVTGSILFLCALPLLRLAITGARSAGFEGIAGLLADPQLWPAFRNSLTTSLLGMILSVVLGMVFALALTLTDLRRRSALGILFILPMMIPPQVTALAWIGMTGPSSALLKAVGLAPPLGSPQPLYSIGGIALLMGVQHAPLVYLTLRASLLSLPRDAIEAARLAGAGRWRTLADIVLPLALPGLVAGASIAFVSGIGNFGIAAILGIPAGELTLPTLIYSRLTAFGAGTFGDIALLAALIAIIAFAGLFIQERALAGRDYRVLGHSGAAASFMLGRWRGPVEAMLWLVIGVILLAPFAALLAGALAPAYGVRLTPDTATLDAFREVLFRQSATRTAFANSFLLAGAAALILGVMSLMTAYLLTRRRGRLARVLSALTDVPYALPGIVISVAFLLLFAAPVPFLGIRLYGTLSIILLAYLSSFLAVALKPVDSAFRQLDPVLEEAARMAGAGFSRRMRDILLPLVAPSALAGAVLVFLFACNELTVSALLWSAGTQTIGVVIYNLDDSGSFNLAAALSVIVVLIVALLMLLLHLGGRYLPRGTVPWQS